MPGRRLLTLARHPRQASSPRNAHVTQPKEPVQTTPPEIPEPGQTTEKLGTIIRLNVNFVEVPVTVKDSKGKLVPGLTWRDFKVYENGIREPLRLFSVDAAPLSIAFVIDQSLTCRRDGQGERLARRHSGRAHAV